MTKIHDMQKLLDSLNQYVEVLAVMNKMNPYDFSIMGGFPRRLFMLCNGFEMTPEDYKGLDESDVDIFCDIASLTDVDKLGNVLNESDLTYEKSNDKLQEDLDNIVIKLIHTIDEIHECSPMGTFCHIQDGVEINPIFWEQIRTTYHIKEVQNKVDLSLYSRGVSNVKGFIGLSPDAQKHHSFNVSAKNISFTIPVCDTIQFIFSNQSNLDNLDTFDMDIAKFKMDYPFNMQNIYAGKTTDIYTVDNIEIRNNVSPFRIIDRIRKYEGYGFTFSETVKRDIVDYTKMFIEKNEVTALPTFKSCLY